MKEDPRLLYEELKVAGVEYNIASRISQLSRRLRTDGSSSSMSRNPRYIPGGRRGHGDLDDPYYSCRG